MDKLKNSLGTVSEWSLKKISILSGRYSKQAPPNFGEIQQHLPARLLQCECKGKFIYFNFSDFSLWSTLGLSGGWTVSKSISHARLKLSFQSIENHETKDLTFYDMRNYGTFKISRQPEELLEKLESLGICWLSDKPTYEEFLAIAKKAKSSRPLGVFLMDQSKTAGIGNYILAEILYRSRLHPWAVCGDLDDTAWKDLHFHIVSVIEASYATQSPRSAYRVDPIGGADAVFQWYVYAQDICPAGFPVVRQIGPHKRTIHWVPQVQTRCIPAGFSLPG